jgi:hypothetical protein
VLPTGITPTTAAINHVVWSEKPRARAVLAAGGEVTLDPTKLMEWVTVEGGRAAEARFVEVGYPAEILADKVTLVDTPGVNDLNEQRAEITYEYVPRADAVIFLLDAGQALKESERAFLASRLLERSRDRLIFVIGKIDLLTPGELEDVRQYVRGHLAKIVSDPPIFTVSARRALAGDHEGSGMGPLTEHLARTLTEDRGRVLLDNATGDGLRAAAYLKQNLGVKRQAMELSLRDLEDRVVKVHAQLTATRESLGKLHDKIRNEAEVVKAQVRNDLERFIGRFEEALPREIEKADASDIRRFLPLFIQDKFKEWAELEGETVGAMLERIAEEAIAVTNENARDAVAAVAEKLGPGDARLEVDVDTFKYDVSVYAVGALGTTVFLFVNSLVGGLLTLAAPIMAIVFHSRITAEIKEDALKKAPAAVRKAAGIMGPHFAQLVDEFVRRLDDFVTSAGDKLYGGIGEVLDKAITERRAQGDGVAEQAAEVGKQLATLGQIEARLLELRQGLWARPPVL